VPICRTRLVQWTSDFSCDDRPVKQSCKGCSARVWFRRWIALQRQKIATPRRNASSLGAGSRGFRLRWNILFVVLINVSKL